MDGEGLRAVSFTLFLANCAKLIGSFSEFEEMLLRRMKSVECERSLTFFFIVCDCEVPEKNNKCSKNFNQYFDV